MYCGRYRGGCSSFIPEHNVKCYSHHKLTALFKCLSVFDGQCMGEKKQAGVYCNSITMLCGLMVIDMESEVATCR